MIAIIYGTTTGNTLDAATKVQAQLGGEDKVELFDVKDIGLGALEYFTKVIFAIPTWDYGEVQEDWQDVWDEVDETDFSDKTMAFIGLGDQYSYSEWFVDAMGMLHDKVVAQGATVVGYWPVEGYDFEESKALTEDKKLFVGLPLDDDCQPELSDKRIEEWCALIQADLAD
ncbi:MAG: flavodoxin [Gammaproteobacteria bacterium]|nr:MAG: flavodoxin [Gammaproteobacteria bacterium]